MPEGCSEQPVHRKEHRDASRCPGQHDEKSVSVTEAYIFSFEHHPGESARQDAVAGEVILRSAEEQSCGAQGYNAEQNCGSVPFPAHEHAVEEYDGSSYGGACEHVRREMHAQVHSRDTDQDDEQDARSFDLSAVRRSAYGAVSGC